MELHDVAERVKTHHEQEGDDETDESLSSGLSEQHLQAHNQQFAKVLAKEHFQPHNRQFAEGFGA
ncbi:MAG: hypothetical protein KAV87_40365 [Desulfobacteraceae bacterium]|nr:hypothetical protein [Desulfobacteraceae bacterium]